MHLLEDQFGGNILLHNRREAVLENQVVCDVIRSFDFGVRGQSLQELRGDLLEARDVGREFDDFVDEELVSPGLLTGSEPHVPGQDRERAIDVPRFCRRRPSLQRGGRKRRVS